MQIEDAGLAPIIVLHAFATGQPTSDAAHITYSAALGRRQFEPAEMLLHVYALAAA
ncbi:hypothetical protein [Paraburkholderia adhaesiva]|uniref:hypothetical protein n=1 Tax=Paraburkholderia adhaesiva TaxID=2883244 RepID=UPI001F422953|nr:hypothetical protein [Paraburkholderia adhaesiva]